MYTRVIYFRVAVQQANGHKNILLLLKKRKEGTMNMNSVMTATAASGHQALAAATVCIYGAIAAVSVHSHSEKNRYHNMTLRAVSLLREAARCSLRADRGNDPTDVYSDAVKASVYVNAVERLLSSAEVGKLCGVSLDELRNHVDQQLSAARTGLADLCARTRGGATGFASTTGRQGVQASFVRT